MEKWGHDGVALACAVLAASFRNFQCRNGHLSRLVCVFHLLDQLSSAHHGQVTRRSNQNLVPMLHSFQSQRLRTKDFEIRQVGKELLTKFVCVCSVQTSHVALVLLSHCSNLTVMVAAREKPRGWSRCPWE